MTTRRGFLGAMLAACAAPAIVRADSLMRVIPRETEILVPAPQRSLADQLEDARQRAIAQLREEIDAQALHEATLQFDRPGLKVGDVFSIAGLVSGPRLFRVTDVMQSGVPIAVADSAWLKVQSLQGRRP